MQVWIARGIERSYPVPQDKIINNVLYLWYSLRSMLCLCIVIPHLSICKTVSILTHMAFISVEYIGKQVWFTWYHSSSNSLSISHSRIAFFFFFFWCKSLASLRRNSIFTLCCLYHPWWQQWNRFPRGVVESKYSNIVWTQPWAAYYRFHCSVSRIGLKDLHKSFPTSNIQWCCGSLLLLHSTSFCSFSQGHWEYGRHVHLLSLEVFHGMKCEYLLRYGLLWAERQHHHHRFPHRLQKNYCCYTWSTTYFPSSLWDLQGCFPYFFLLLSQLLHSIFNNFLNMLSQRDHQHHWCFQPLGWTGSGLELSEGGTWTFSLSGLFSQKSSLQLPGYQNFATQTK